MHGRSIFPDDCLEREALGRVEGRGAEMGGEVKLRRGHYSRGVELFLVCVLAVDADGQRALRVKYRSQ